MSAKKKDSSHGPSEPNGSSPLWKTSKSDIGVSGSSGYVWDPLRDLGFPQFPYPHHMSRELLCAVVGMNSSNRLQSRSKDFRTPHRFLDAIEKNDADAMQPGSSDVAESELLELNSDQRSELRRLSEEPDYAPSDEVRDKYKSCLPLETLAGMPFHFREHALLKFREGIRIFGKIPVRKESNASECPSATSRSGSVSVAEPARPIGCPEKAPEGTEFILAWKEGEFWNWNLGDFEFQFEEVPPGKLHPRLRNESEKYIHCLMKHLESMDSPMSQRARDILSIADRQRHAREGIEATDFEIGLYAGVLFARRFLYKSSDEYYATNSSSRKSAWPEILRHAFQRHGLKISNEELFDRLGCMLGGKKIGRKNSLTEGEIEFADWPYTPYGENQSYQKLKKKADDVRVHLRRSLRQGSA